MIIHRPSIFQTPKTAKNVWILPKIGSVKYYAEGLRNDELVARIIVVLETLKSLEVEILLCPDRRSDELAYTDTSLGTVL